MAKFSIKDSLVKFHRGCGVYIDGKEIYICRVVTEFHGISVAQRITGSLGDKNLERHLRDIFPLSAEAADVAAISDKPQGSIPARVLRWFLALPELTSAGIKDASVFYYAFATSFKPGKVLEMDALVSDDPRAEFLHAGNLSKDWIHVQINNQNYILMCAAKKPALEEVTTAFDKVGVTLVRVESGAMAALRAAWYQHPPQGGKLPEIRVITGPAMTLAAMAHDRLPLAWQLIPAQPGSMAESLFPVIQSFMTYSQKQLNFPAMGQILLQGDSIDPDEAAKLSDMTSIPCKIARGMPYDGNMIAYGLAIGALDTDTKPMNLARAGHKHVSLAMVFPYLETLITLLITFSALLFMYGNTMKADKIVRMQKAINAQDPKLSGMSVGDIDGNNKQLKDKITPLAELFTGKTQWCSVIDAITKLMTPDVRIISFVGDEPVWVKKKSVNLTLTIVARSSPKTSPETEVGNFLNKLRESPELSKIFQNVTVNSIQLTKGGEEIQARLSLSSGGSGKK